MQSLKACARLPALAEIAVCRSHSAASWLTVLVVRVSPGGGVPVLLLPPGREVCGGAHAAKSINAAKNPSFMNHPRSRSLSSRKSPLIPLLSKAERCLALRFCFRYVATCDPRRNRGNGNRTTGTIATFGTGAQRLIEPEHSNVTTPTPCVIARRIAPVPDGLRSRYPALGTSCAGRRANSGSRQRRRQSAPWR
jgi:hypothetical protein